MRISSRIKILLQIVVMSGVAVSVAVGASAQSDPRMPTIQKAPTYLKFQAQITQAKLPVGDVTFNQVLVNIRAGDNTLCTETLPNVVVREGVLNLEIGRDLRKCQLEQYLAQYSDLSFQVCLNSAENCLKPVAMSSVPFAIKATFAQSAELAKSSQRAVVADYAQRLTAERNPFNPAELGKGYFDFATPPSANVLSKPGDDPRYAAGGYMLWAPTATSAPMLNIASKSVEADAPPGPLAGVLVHANEVRVRGAEAIEAGLDVAGTSMLHGLTTTGDLTCGGVARMAGASFDYENTAGRFGVAASTIALSSSTELRIAGTGSTVVDTPVVFNKEVSFTVSPGFTPGKNTVDESRLTEGVRGKLASIESVKGRVDELGAVLADEIDDPQRGFTYLPEWILGDPPVPGNNTIAAAGPIWANGAPAAGGACVKLTSQGFKTASCTEQLPFVCAKRSVGAPERGAWARGYRACRTLGGFILPASKESAGDGWNGQDAWVAATSIDGNGLWYRPSALRAWALVKAGRI